MLLKVFIIVVIFLVNCQDVICQMKKVPIFLNYENSSGEKGITIFEYDGNKRLVKARWQLKDTSRWSTNYYFYNNKNQLIEKYREFSDGLTSRVTYEYNEVGNKVSETFWRSDDVSGKSTFLYNKEGILEKIDCIKYNGWFDGEIMYSSDEDNKLISARLLKNGVNIGTIRLNYTNDDYLKTEKWITPEWNQTFTWDYTEIPQTCTSSNIFIKENTRFRLYFEGYSFNRETGGPSFFDYTEDGLLLQKTFERSDNLTTETFFEYDNKGLLLKSFRNYNNGNAAEFTYEFNNYRQLVKRRGKFTDEKYSLEQYFYNEKGELTHATWENFDNWLTGTLTFKNSNNGSIESGIFKGEEFNASLVFKYNEFGNLAEIVWHFSFGKKQTYQFEYQDLINEQYIAE